MTLVKRISLPSRTHERHGISLTNPASVGNRLTVLVGVNGTHKSRILKDIIDDALHVLNANLPSLPIDVGTIFKLEPKKVIALSAVPSDRFPAKQNSGFRYSSKYDVDQYEYIGPRQGANLVSRNQSVETLALAALTGNTPNAATAAFIERVCRKAGISTKFRIRFSFYYSAKVIKGKIIDSDPEVSPNKKHLEISRIPPQYMADVRKIVELQSKIDDEGGMEIDLTGRNSFFDCDPQAIRAAFNAKLFKIRSLGFYSVDDTTPMKPNDFSAGQWSLFSSLPTLALQCVDRSLILVDEPESALHPAWQRTYIDDLTEAISHRSECHVFLATHSPLIVGSLGNRLTDLISLKRNGDGGCVDASLLTTPTGWEVNDVLEEVFELKSTRSPQIVRAMDEILGLIVGGVAQNKEKLLSALKAVRPLIAGLPNDDILRSVFISAAAVVEQGR